MSRLRKTGLTIDDPLAPAERPEPAASPRTPVVAKKTSAADPPSPRRRPLRMEESQPAPARGGAWRSWSGPTRVASYRLPDELLAELAARSADLQLQVGLLVTAAITHLLDETDDAISGLVDRADDARIQGRRAARRRCATTPAAPTPSAEAATL
jgi:hypothetical protein